MPDHRTPKYLLDWKPAHGKRSWERSRRNWQNVSRRTRQYFQEKQSSNWIRQKSWPNIVRTGERWYDTSGSSSVQATRMIEETLSSTSTSTFVSSGKVFMVLHDSFLLILDHNCTKLLLILLWVQLMMSSMKGQLIFTRHIIYGLVRLCELPIKSQIGPLNSFPNLLDEWAGRLHRSYTHTSLWLQQGIAKIWPI